MDISLWRRQRGIGWIVMTVSWYVKARLEEDFLREQLGREQYDAYARRVPMLVPFVKFSWVHSPKT